MTTAAHSKPVARKKGASKTNKKKQSLVKVVVLEDVGQWVRPEKGSKHTISEAPLFPEIVFEIQTSHPGPYEWHWTMRWDAQVSGLRESAKRGKAVGTFKDSGTAITQAPTWKADLSSKIIGGTLTVEVSVAGERFRRSVFVVGANPSKDNIGAYIKSLGDVDGLIDLLEQETHTKHFINADGQPIVAFDKGFGITQITHPSPNFEQAWNWKENVKAGATVYREKCRIAKSYLGQAGRAYTNEQLKMDIWAQYNGGHYYKWNTEDKVWERNPDVLCDSNTSNIGWNTTNTDNTGKSEEELHKRDSASYAHPSKDRHWIYSGVCYADHVEAN